MPKYNPGDEVLVKLRVLTVFDPKSHRGDEVLYLLESLDEDQYEMELFESAIVGKVEAAEPTKLGTIVALNNLTWTLVVETAWRSGDREAKFLVGKN